MPGKCFPPAAGLAKLKALAIRYSPITVAGCAALAVALDSGALPALEELRLYGTLASEEEDELMARFVFVGPLTEPGNTSYSESSDEE